MTTDQWVALLTGPLGTLVVLALGLWLMIDGKLVPGWLYRDVLAANQEQRAAIADLTTAVEASTETSRLVLGVVQAIDATVRES